MKFKLAKFRGIKQRNCWPSLKRNQIKMKNLRQYFHQNLLKCIRQNPIKFNFAKQFFKLKIKIRPLFLLFCKLNEGVCFAKKAQNSLNSQKIHLLILAKISSIKAGSLTPTSFSTRELKSKMQGFCPFAFVALSAAAMLSKPSPPASANSLS